MAYGYSANKIGLNENNVDNAENTAHFKLKLTKTFSTRFKLAVGGDYFITDFNEDYNEPTGFDF